MAILSFNVQANYEEITRLRLEIDRLEARMKSFKPGDSDAMVRATAAQLRTATNRFTELSDAAAKAGAAMELNISRGANSAIASVDALYGKLSNPITGLTEIAGLAAMGSFLTKITQIRSQFQQMESSINTMVGEKKGEKLMAQLTEFAKMSPLDFKGTVSGAQMMLGFGIEAEKIPRYLSAIGDVSMGNAQRFQSLNLAFSQMSAAGKLMGQDLLNFVA